jgi:hypothetical protein
MPPKQRLSDGEVKVLEGWVKMGAPDPREAAPVVKRGRTIDINEGRKFWSFTPLARPEPPALPAAAAGPLGCSSSLQPMNAAPRPAHESRPSTRLRAVKSRVGENAMARAYSAGTQS